MIEILANNLGRKEVKCPKCESRLRYAQEDIKSRFIEYERYHNIYEKDEKNYITCPVCNYEIKVNKYIMTL